MKLWCFGDSNTYGYDPCGFFGGRYAAPWPALLAEKTGFQVINDGKNGRMIPCREYEFLQFRRDAERYNADALIVMLGTNTGRSFPPHGEYEKWKGHADSSGWTPVP